MVNVATVKIVAPSRVGLPTHLRMRTGCIIQIRFGMSLNKRFVND